MTRALNLVFRSVATVRGVELKALVAEVRTPRVSHARHEAMYLARQTTPASLPEIGEALGGRCRATVLSGIRSIEQRIDETVGYGDELEAIGAQISLRIHELELPRMVGSSRRGRQESEAVQLLAREVASVGEQLADIATRLDALERRPLPEAVPTADPHRSIGLPRPVLRALSQFEQDRFTRGERLSLDRLITSLTETRSATRGDA